MSLEKLYIKEVGVENSETIIFIHSGTMASWMYDEQIKAFRDYHCLIPDLPEHGQSIGVKPFTIKDSAEKIITIIENKAHNGKAHLVGISLGGQIILQILSIKPNIVEDAFISGTLTCTIPETETFLKLLNYTTRTYAPVMGTDFFIKANMRSYNMPKHFFNNFKKSTQIINPDAFKRILAENMLFKLPDDLINVKTPVLVMAGEKDYRIIQKSAYNLIKTLKNSQGYIAPRVGHLWNLESPNLFNKILKYWMNNIDMNDILLKF
ncbi:MAG: alpha/beta hydrolase [Methanobacterium sp.]|nr:alpha/beta hydrolase [Methanobacterium sp.]